MIFSMCLLNTVIYICKKGSDHQNSNKCGGKQEKMQIGNY